MRRIGIISSFDTFCGNATYSEVLAQALANVDKDNCEIKRISLNQEILRDPAFIKDAKNHIKNLCRQASECDGVNIHFEFGLFGYNLKFQSWAIKELIKSSKNCLITVHRLEKPVNFPNFRLKYFAKPLDFFRDIKSYYIRSPYSLAFASLIKFAKSHGAKFVSHHQLCTRRMQSSPFNIKKDNIITYPITFLNRKEQNLLSKADKKDIEAPPVMLPAKKIIRIGLSGFVSSNKGHECAIRSLSFLPSYYNLFILGSRHPYESSNDYSISLYKLVETLGLTDRVHFCGRSNTSSEFYNRILFCDVMVFPYQETGLIGSGNLALARDMRKLLVLSSIEAFEENSKFYPNDYVSFFDPLSPMECAHAIATLEKPNQDNINEINIDVLSSMLYDQLSGKS